MLFFYVFFRSWKDQTPDVSGKWRSLFCFTGMMGLKSGRSITPNPSGVISCFCEHKHQECFISKSRHIQEGKVYRKQTLRFYRSTSSFAAVMLHLSLFLSSTCASAPALLSLTCVQVVFCVSPVSRLLSTPRLLVVHLCATYLEASLF